MVYRARQKAVYLHTKSEDILIKISFRESLQGRHVEYVWRCVLTLSHPVYVARKIAEELISDAKVPYISDSPSGKWASDLRGPSVL